MSEVISSSTHAPAPIGIISQKTMFKDMTSQVLHGRCSACGHIDPKEYVQCVGGDLLCPPCKIDFKGKPHCEDHIREFVGDETMFFVLYGLSIGTDKPRITKAAAITERQAKDAFKRLRAKGYVELKDYGKQEIKLTSEGRLALDVLLRVFSKYANAVEFMSGLGRPRV